MTPVQYLNTSNVSINRSLSMFQKKILVHLNTSNVSINHRKPMR